MENTSKKIVIDEDYFEHLLACLANQKFIGEAPPNGDALSLGEKKYNKIQKEHQKIIDEAWRKGMDMLSHSSFSASGGKARALSLSKEEKSAHAKKMVRAREAKRRTKSVPPINSTK